MQIFSFETWQIIGSTNTIEYKLFLFGPWTVATDTFAASQCYVEFLQKLKNQFWLE